MTDDYESALAQHVAGFDRAKSYRVVHELKRSDAEVTELVMFEGSAGGALGPFVRKRIDERAQTGAVYERLFAAQRAGRRFAHLPRIIDCRRTSGELVVVMEYIDGETLEALVRRLGPTPQHVVTLFGELCRAVEELHTGFYVEGEGTRPVIHRDLKPSNIMVAGARYAPETGLAVSSLVIIDLGIARVWSDGAASDTVKLGTRAYAPPEQFGFGQTSVRSDIYALGGILFFCLTGRDPEPGLAMREQCARLDVPEALAEVVAHAMAFDPAQRYGSAEALRAAALRAYARLTPDGAGERRDTGSSVDEGVGSELPFGRFAASHDALSRPVAAYPDKTQLLQTMRLSWLPAVARRESDDAVASLARDDGMASATQSFERRHRICAAIARLIAPLGRLLAHVPEPIGRIWNAMLYLSLAVIMLGCHWAVFFPTGANRAYPTWFLAVEYFLMVDVSYAATVFILLDKRRLRRRFPSLERVRGARLVWVYLLAFTVPVFVTMLVTVIANVSGAVST